MATNKEYFYGWTLVGVMFMLYLINGTFPYYGASVINTHMAHSLDLSKSVLGLGFSVFTISLALSAPLVGFCITRRGIRFTFTMGGLIILVGAVLMATVVTSGWLFILVFGIVVGLGVSMGSAIPAQTGVTNWFRRRRAMAMAIVLSSTGIGAIVCTPLMNRVIVSFDHDWRAGWLLVIAMTVVSSFLAAIAVKNRPEDLGQVPDGIPGGSNPAVRTKAHHVYQSAGSWSLKASLGTRAIWLIVFAAIAFLCPFVTCVAHSLVHLQSLGCPDTLVVLSLGLMAFFSIIGRLLAGGLGDRVEPRRIWSVALFSTAMGMIFLIHFDDWGNAAVYLYAFCMGAGMGGAYVSLATIVGNYFGPRYFASIMGTIFPIIFLVAGVAPYAAGFNYDLQGNYTAAFYVLMVLSITGAVAILFAAPPSTGRDEVPV
ncbi:MFS transporter [uncultured Desulfosarcina sp.]|uniref:MFS transporter n=1 Tax=uncultured Desulfosarcina sp. TaxID=218289 RepID=UPI0029C98083|nr:MFS transporter [uncultured Desulfosarcina sp.]